jgi:UDP-N-acetylglucosamine transferase subunit ALG13
LADWAKFNNSTRKPLVLLSPLDWGLGHTTRCIPIIKELAKLGCDIVIACNSTQKKILQQEPFTSVSYIELDGYNIRYGKSRLATLGWLLFQGPKILTNIKREHKWLKAFLATRPVDAIISDNRFGLYATSIPAFFITHQLQIKTGLGAFADNIVRKWNYRRILPFTSCWVPDNVNQPSLAGELSHPATMPGIPVHYIGGLSRLEACDNKSNEHLLIILSGPEPQRSIFEMLLLQQAKDHPGKIVMVRGLPATETIPTAPAHCTLYNHVDAETLRGLICRAGFVVSRCGYTTVMDLLKLAAKNILVPTPGQAEQEYLAIHLRKQQLAYTLPQHHFRLNEALQAAAQFPYTAPAMNMNDYKPVLASLVEMITNNGYQADKDLG